MKTALASVSCAIGTGLAAWGGLVLFAPQASLDQGLRVFAIALGVGALSGALWRVRPGAKR